MAFEEIIKKYKNDVFPKIGFHQQNILRKIEKCRTPELGGHLYVCDECNSTLMLHNSCSNRNCPVCQGNKRKKWIEKQCENLVNVPYFHVVFTVPDILNNIFIKYQEDFYNILFHSAWETLKLFFKKDKSLSGKGGMLCILHTWGQNLSFHPHLHCLVPAAGISENGDLKLIRGKDKFLFNVKNLGKVFRAKFAEKITKLEKQTNFIFPPIIRKLMFEKNWVVYAQKPFSTPENVVRYIGMYSHRVAISANRILEEKNGEVKFNYKDYKDGGTIKIATLKSEEFLRRFAMHILPFKFMKIRYFGYFNNRCKKEFLQKAKDSVGLYINHEETNTDTNENSEILNLDYELDDQEIVEKKHSHDCKNCNKGKLNKFISFSKEQFRAGLLVIDCKTGEILYKSRDGPSENFFICKISM
jgi:hypothetical protein